MLTAPVLPPPSRRKCLPGGEETPTPEMARCGLVGVTRLVPQKDVHAGHLEAVATISRSAIVIASAR
jgi:hypothetical protein